MKHKLKSDSLQASVLRTSRIHFLYAAAYAIAIIIFDSWNLIVPTVIKQRWMVAGLLLVVTALVWYAVRSYRLSSFWLRAGLFSLIVADVIAAAFTVYSERGMASPAVMLFAIPLVVAASLKSYTLIFATACLSTAAYAMAIVGYFVDHPSEGYKIQLYGMLALYTAIFFILAAFLSSFIKSRTK